MDRDTALQKVKKCLALAGSSNPNEAATAMRQAQKLMEQFDISDVDVSLADVKEAAQKARSSTVSRWEALLARVISDAFSCESLIRRGYLPTFIGGAKKGAEFRFVGVGAAAEVASYAFQVLYRQAHRDRQAHIAAQRKSIKQATKTARGDAFAMAWVMAVEKLVERFAGSPEKADLLVDYMAKTYPGMGEARTAQRHLNRHVRGDSYAEGARAGKQARLDRAVTSSQTAQQIGHSGD